MIIGCVILFVDRCLPHMGHVVTSIWCCLIMDSQSLRIVKVNWLMIIISSLTAVNKGICKCNIFSDNASMWEEKLLKLFMNFPSEFGIFGFSMENSFHAREVPFLK